MKKIIISILAFLYLFVSSGVALEIHYCMGKKAGTDLYAKANDTCSKCGMKEKKGGCCSNEHKFYKVDDAHKNVSNNLSFQTPVFIFNHLYTSFSQPATNSVAVNSFRNHSPPEYTGASTCILNCTFRI